MILSLLFIMTAIFAPSAGLCPSIFDGQGIRRRHFGVIGIILFAISVFYYHRHSSNFWNPLQSWIFSVRKQRTILSYLLNLFISCVSILFTFALLELAVRIPDGDFHFRNNLRQTRNLFQSMNPTEYHPELGWIPRPGFYGKQDGLDTTITILEHGIRSNGNHFNSQEDFSTILAIGDSFTFGDQVSDNETWPAILETLTGRHVINAGVFGYGIDQSFIRAQKLIPLYKPETVIFSFIPNDIGRCELSKRSHAGKPYFEVKDSELLLKNTPVPSPSKYEIGKFRQFLSYSQFIHRIMMKAVPQYWLQGMGGGTKIHADGEKVTCLLFQELEHLGETYNTEIYILIQYPKESSVRDLQRVAPVIDCLSKSRMNIVDLQESLNFERERDYGTYKSFFNKHMTPEGNRFVAQKLYEAMSR